MVTVEADVVRVEFRLAVGGIGCPTCRDGVLGGWAYARARQIEGLSDPLRPWRARCRPCKVTHVLLPVTCYCTERVRRNAFGLRWPHHVVGGPVAGVVDPASTRGGDADPGPAVLRADG